MRQHGEPRTVTDTTGTTTTLIDARPEAHRWATLVANEAAEWSERR
jgi:hypothetical protein